MMRWSNVASKSIAHYTSRRKLVADFVGGARSDYPTSLAAEMG